MKVIRSIGLFFALGSALVLIGFLGGLNYGMEIRQKPGMEQETEPLKEQEEQSPFEGFLDVASLSGNLSADCEYVVEEVDVLKGTSMETTMRLPAKYVGMDRERFLSAMKQFNTSPPLSERERGFVSAQVLSFSRERVVVQMNYRFVQPGECFYLALMDHQIVVLLEDQRTVYITTGITFEMLSEKLQEEILKGILYVEDETVLYDFLETYSS